MSIGAHRVSSYANIRCIEDVDGTKSLNMLYDLLMLTQQVTLYCTTMSYDSFQILSSVYYIKMRVFIHKSVSSNIKLRS